MEPNKTEVTSFGKLQEVKELEIEEPQKMAEAFDGAFQKLEASNFEKPHAFQVKRPLEKSQEIETFKFEEPQKIRKTSHGQCQELGTSKFNEPQKMEEAQLPDFHVVDQHLEFETVYFASPEFGRHNLEVKNPLFKNLERLNELTGGHRPLPYGHHPRERPIAEYIKSGYIVIDKPSMLSSNTIASQIKDLFKVKKIGHSGTSEPMSGCFMVFLDNATQLVRQQQMVTNDYVVSFILDSAVKDIEQIKQALEKLTGPLCASSCWDTAAHIKNERLKLTVYNIRLLKFDESRNTGVFWLRCKVGTLISHLCVHFGSMLGIGIQMIKVRQYRSGMRTVKDKMVTMQDITYAQWVYDNHQDENYIRRVIRPMEELVVIYKRIFIVDTAIGAICHGADVYLANILWYENNIELSKTIVIVSSKGEAVALAKAVMTTSQISSNNNRDALAAKIRTVLMEKNTYPMDWDPETMQRDDSLFTPGPYELVKRGREEHEKFMLEFTKNFIGNKHATHAEEKKKEKESERI